ncbi:zinc-dependent alcohol dehydrogenase family protein [Nocardioides taihuensis]|uniref:alcohol dehydrogenase n=1 Tax=Nocardioides taihuensis TaxID=1835606 RepID=A0ABW0BQF6_9ACTN
MRAWYVDQPGPIATHPLALGERPDPEPGPGDLLLRVLVCGVCRTDLHLAEGDLAPRRHGVVPGHQVVGVVEALGADLADPSGDPAASGTPAVGDRVGIAWLRGTCGRCRWCRRGEENLCPASTYTGWDADGGFAERAVVPAAFAYALPPGLDDEHLAPLLCGGIIGYRALRRANLPPGGRLGIYGFGSSAHLTAQVAMAGGAEVHVLTRDEGSRALARELGVASVGGATDRPPVPLDSAIVFAPVGELVPVALEALDRGGTLALAGIHMTDVPSLHYARHLFLERDLRTVTANTRADGEDLLRLAAVLDLDVRTTSYAFGDTGTALRDLAEGRVTGSAVVRVADG